MVIGIKGGGGMESYGSIDDFIMEIEGEEKPPFEYLSFFIWGLDTQKRKDFE